MTLKISLERNLKKDMTKPKITYLQVRKIIWQTLFLGAKKNVGPMAGQQMAALDKCKSYNETFQKIVLGMT